MSEIIVYLLACALAAFCSGTETAFSAAGRIRIAAKGRRGKPALWFLNRPARYLVTTLVGTNVGVVLASSIGHGWGAGRGELWEYISAFFTAVFLLVFAEVIPKQLSLFRSDTTAVLSAVPLRIIRYLLFPLIVLASSVSGLIAGRDKRGRFFESRKEVRGLLVSSGGEQGRLAAAVLAMSEAPFEEYSIPLNECPSVKTSAERNEAVGVLLDSGEGFLLVWEKKGSALAGIVRGTDLVRWDGTGAITRLSHPLKQPLIFLTDDGITGACVKFLQFIKQKRIISTLAGRVGAFTKL